MSIKAAAFVVAIAAGAAAAAVVVASAAGGGVRLGGSLAHHNWEQLLRLSGLWLSMLTQLIGIICFNN